MKNNKNVNKLSLYEFFLIKFFLTFQQLTLLLINIKHNKKYMLLKIFFLKKHSHRRRKSIDRK